MKQNIKKDNSLVFVSYGDATDPKVWSKTPSILWNFFLKKKYTLYNINLKNIEGGFTRLVYKGLVKLGVVHTTRMPFMYSIYCKKLNKQLQKNKTKNILFIAEHCLNTNSDINHDYYLYLDSLMRPLFDADNDYNWIRKKTLSIYENNDKESLSRMKKIFTQNDWSRKYLIHNYGISPNIIKNVRFGINVTPLKEEKNYDNNLLLIVLREGTEYRKGLYLLLDAFKIITNQIENVKLAVVGVQGKNIKGVTYYYNSSRETTIKLFKECTLYTMPAIKEPNGITYLEALANKAPIVGLNRFSVPEFSGYGKWGFIANSPTPECVAQTIIDALSDKNRLKTMGKLGQEFVMENYVWEKTSEIILEEIKQ